MRTDRPIATRSSRPRFGGMLLCVAVLVMSSATTAHAQTRPFSVHDTNGDGYLSREEYGLLLELRRERHRQRGRMDPQPAPAFDDVDRNGNGLIDESELADALGHTMYRYGRHGQRWRYPGQAR
jgi:Ca2+-binding EF-hand superfamily protein